MQHNNLELELRRYEPSTRNDKITYEKHYYNGFSGLEGEEAYQRYLQGLYDTYFIELRQKIDMLALSNIDTLLKFLQTKIDLFNDIHDKEYNNSTRWTDYKCFESMIIRDETVDKQLVQNSQGAKNDYHTMKFFVRMIGTQLYFIDKAVNELTQIYNTYSPQPQPKQLTREAIEKETWESTLSEYGDLINTFEVAKIFDKDEATIRRWKREGKITPIDETARPMQFMKDEIKRYYLKITAPKY
ncbi:MAG: hypothetical protein LBH46_00250 [Rickettsiales bacterium]|jgi:hypothetical protein|nr:hypothetical protein [Rickettsiales bacterium]